MPSTNNSLRTVAAIAICTAWQSMLWSREAGQYFWLVAGLVLALVGISGFWLRALAYSRLSLPWFGVAFCALTLTLLMFTVWSRLITYVVLPPFPHEWPKALRVIALFLLAPMLGVAVAAAFSYPLSILLPRTYWLIPVLAAALVAIIQFESLTGQATRPITRSLMLWELACLLFIVPAFLRFLASRSMPSRNTDD